MSARAQLRRLGQLYGIEPGYTDFWGRRRRVSATTERALLEAMGIAAGSEHEIAASLREAAARPWRRLLAPVRVLAPPDPPEVTFSLPHGHAGARVRWSLVEEAGGVQEGEAAIEDLPAVAEAEVEGERYRRWRLRLPHELPLGYHQLRLSVGAGGGRSRSRHERPDRRAAAMFSARRGAGWRTTPLGPRLPALWPALRAQLGHGRLY